MNKVEIYYNQFINSGNADENITFNLKPTKIKALEFAESYKNDCVDNVIINSEINLILARWMQSEDETINFVTNEIKKLFLKQ